MNSYFLKYIMAFLACAAIATTYADSVSELSPYDIINHAGMQDARAVQPCDLTDKKHFLKLAQDSDLNLQIKMDSDNHLSSPDSDTTELYCGDFNNRGSKQYALVETAGSMHADTLSFYSVNAGKLVPLDLDNAIQKSTGSSIEDFYLLLGRPIAVIKNGKTYLRYLSITTGDRNDSASYELCTYYWQEDNFSLVGPNVSIVPPEYHLQDDHDCVKTE